MAHSPTLSAIASLIAAQLLVSTAAADAPNFSPKSLGGQAMAAAQQSGMPVLTLGVSESCVYCKQLMQLLKNDPVTAQFIVVPMDTVNNPHWTEWTQTYKPLGPNVPVMFIVRADGELLKMVPGLPEGGVATILRDALEKAGKPLDAPQAKRMSAALAKAKGSYGAKRIEAALDALLPISGTGSYASLAMEAEALLAKISEEADQQIDAAEALLKDPDQVLDGAIQLLEANRLYARIPTKKEVLTTLVKKYTEDEATKTALEQAQLLADAEKLFADRKKDEAASALQSIVQNYPGSAVAEKATARLTELKLTPAISSASAGTPKRDSVAKPDAAAIGKMRTWSDVTGRYKIEAALAAHTSDKVTLKKADGTQVVVPLTKLSVADRAFLAKQSE